MFKVWLITGSSRGLGREVALAALAAGHRVVATARRPEQLRELVEEHGERLLPVALDVADPAAAEAAVRAAADTFGRLDVVVNNAGYANFGSIEDTPAEDFRAQVETNFFGVVNVSRAALPVLRAQGSGHLIQVSSIGGRVASPGLAAYQSAKWAVNGFSGVLAAEVGPLGIKVTVVEPGGLRTDWAGSSMTVHPFTEPYRPVYELRERLIESGALATGDPARAAQVILEVAEMEDPPLRLLLGSDAVALAEHTARVQAESDARWRSVSMSTDQDQPVGAPAPGSE